MNTITLCQCQLPSFYRYSTIDRTTMTIQSEQILTHIHQGALTLNVPECNTFLKTRIKSYNDVQHFIRSVIFWKFHKIPNGVLSHMNRFMDVGSNYGRINLCTRAIIENNVDVVEFLFKYTELTLDSLLEQKFYTDIFKTSHQCIVRVIELQPDEWSGEVIHKLYSWVFNNIYEHNVQVQMFTYLFNKFSIPTSIIQLAIQTDNADILTLILDWNLHNCVTCTTVMTLLTTIAAETGKFRCLLLLYKRGFTVPLTQKTCATLIRNMGTYWDCMELILNQDMVEVTNGRGILTDIVKKTVESSSSSNAKLIIVNKQMLINQWKEQIKYNDAGGLV